MGHGLANYVADTERMGGWSKNEVAEVAHEAIQTALSKNGLPEFTIGLYMIDREEEE